MLRLVPDGYVVEPAAGDTGELAVPPFDAARVDPNAGIRPLASAGSFQSAWGSEACARHSVSSGVSVQPQVPFCCRSQVAVS